jgi:ribonucleoside-triphosphate reductase
LYDSKSGERGVFNRDASKRIVEKLGKRDPNYDFGTNPCSEIILRPFQFCNLTEVVVRAEDTDDDLKGKFASLQSLAQSNPPSPDFRYLRKSGKRTPKKNDSSVSRSPASPTTGRLFGTTSGELLNELKELANEVNAEWADRLGIPRSAAITCVKPSGTVLSLLIVLLASILAGLLIIYGLLETMLKTPLPQFLIKSPVYRGSQILVTPLRWSLAFLKSARKECCSK